MRQTSKTRRTIGIRGQLMGFLCFICFLLVGLFWFLSTQLLEPLYTTHIQKQLTEQAEAIVARMDEAIERGETLSYWAFGSQLYVNNTFFNSLRDDIFETGGMSSFCIDISDTTLRQIFKVDNLSYCNLHRTRPTDSSDEKAAYTTARAMRQLCRESGGAVVRKINPPSPSGSVQLMVGRMTADGNYTVLVTTSLMHVAEAGKVLSTVLPLAAALIFAFSMSDTFDTLGTFIGTGRRTGIFSAEDEKALENGHGFSSKMDKALFADSIATSIGAICGTSNTSTYVESSAGIAAGGRTGLTSVVVAICFALSAFLAPVVSAVPSAATAGVLVIVGCMMAASLKEVKWDDIAEAIPAFFAAVFMAFSYSISYGIAGGFIMYCIVKTCKGKAKEVHPIIWTVAALFILDFVCMAIL